MAAAQLQDQRLVAVVDVFQASVVAQSRGFEASRQSCIFALGQLAVDHQAETFIEAEIIDVGRCVLLAQRLIKMFKSALNWPPVLRPAAGLHSTAEDLANWVIALQSGLLLKETSSIDKMLTVPPMYDGSPGIWGIGWHLGKSVKGGLPAPGGGAKAQVVLYPEELGIVLLTNLLGAFPEHLAPVRAEQIDLAFVDPIARYFSS